MTVGVDLSAGDAEALVDIAEHEAEYSEGNVQRAWIAISRRADKVREEGGTVRLKRRWARLLRVRLEMEEPTYGLDQTVLPQCTQDGGA